MTYELKLTDQRDFKDEPVGETHNDERERRKVDSSRNALGVLVDPVEGRKGDQRR